MTGHYGDRMPEDRAAKAGNVAMTAAYQFGFAVSPDGRKVVAIASGDEAAAFSVWKPTHCARSISFATVR